MSSPSLVSASTLRGSLLASSDAAFFSIRLNVHTYRVIPSNTWSTKNKLAMHVKSYKGAPTSTPVRDWNATIEFLSRGTQSLPAAPIRPLTSSASSADALGEATLHCIAQPRLLKTSWTCPTRSGKGEVCRGHGITEKSVGFDEGVPGGGDGREEEGRRLLLLLPQQLLGPSCARQHEEEHEVRQVMK